VGTAALTDFLISPDGNGIAFGTAGKWQVYDVAKQATTAGPDTFTAPVEWSRDGRFILFNAGGQPRLLDSTTGQALTVLDSPRQNFWVGDGNLAPDLTFMAYWVPSIRQEWRQLTGVTTDAVLKAMKARK
jgi:hypothetical protein